MTFHAVHAVRPSRETPPADNIGDERVRDRNFGFGRDLVGSHRLFDAVREHLRGDLADGGVDRLARRAAEIFQFEEIPGIGRFDGAQGRGFRCVGDRGETEFDLASVGRSADEGVDRDA